MSPNEQIGFGICDLENGWPVGRFEALSGIVGISHLVTTQKGPDFTDIDAQPDCSAGLADIMNIGGLVWCKQMHGNTVLEAAKLGLAGECDGLVTDAKNLGLMVRSADCPLIMIADKAGNAIGVAHASWRGTVKQIASQLVNKLTACYSSEPGDLIACIAPSAGGCCYEVRQDVLDAAAEGIGSHAERFFETRDGKMYLDLWAANTDQLVRAGVEATNIHVAGVCTICSEGLFPSYRVQGQAAGRFGAVLAIT